MGFLPFISLSKKLLRGHFCIFLDFSRESDEFDDEACNYLYMVRVPSRMITILLLNVVEYYREHQSEETQDNFDINMRHKQIL